MALPNLSLPNYRTWNCQIPVRDTAKFGTAKLPYVSLPNFRTWRCRLLHSQTAGHVFAKLSHVALPNLALPNYRMWLCKFPYVVLPNFSLPNCSTWYSLSQTHSTETSLIHLLDSIYHAADNGLATLLLSLDLSASFDTIDHIIHLNRLTSSFGIMGSSHNWLKSYLSNRSFL